MSALWGKKSIEDARKAGILSWAVTDFGERHGEQRELFVRVRDTVLTSRIKRRAYEAYYVEFLDGRRERVSDSRHEDDESYIAYEVSRLVHQAMAKMSAHERLDLISHFHWR